MCSHCKEGQGPNRSVRFRQVLIDFFLQREVHKYSRISEIKVSQVKIGEVINLSTELFVKEYK